MVQAVCALQWVLAPGQDATYTTEGGAKVIRFPSDMVSVLGLLCSAWNVPNSEDACGMARPTAAEGS